MFTLPNQVITALDMLSENEFEAFIVGGCVRDFILGKVPYDYDITTNALPSQIKDVFRNFKIIETGIKHGTVTVIIDHMPLEITTYRIDGEYKDNRHPLSVSYTSELKNDLSRRDFTMNALAYNHNAGLKDYFNGRNDIENKNIVCVGNPQERFNEDALRIMRAIRFSSQLGFDIEKNTSECIFKQKDFLKNISAERIQAELNKLIVGDNVYNVLMKYSDVFEIFIPEIHNSIGFEQKSKYHKYDVWEHTAVAVSKACKDKCVRLAMLLHDVGKPFSCQENGNTRHFKGHAKVSAGMAYNILKRLKYDNATLNMVVNLIEHHSDKFESEKQIKHSLSALGEDTFFKLIEVKKADNLAKKDFCAERIPKFGNIKKQAEDIINSDSCLKVSDLKINGNDLKNIGLKGKRIGEILSLLLDMVIEDKIENEYNSLISYAKIIANSDL